VIESFMSITTAQFTAALDALREVLAFRHPADAVLSHFFRNHRQLGQLDRAFVAESVFACCGASSCSITWPKARRCGRRPPVARPFLGRSARELTPLLKPRGSGSRKKSAEPGRAASRAARRFARLGRRAPGKALPDERSSLRRALQQPAPLDLRVNTLRTNRDAVLEKLRGDGIKCEPAPYSPLGVRVHGRLRSIGIASSRRQHRGAGRRQPAAGVPARTAPSRPRGGFLRRRRRQGAHAGRADEFAGRVYAFDVSAARLARLKPRLKRSGLSNLHPHLIRDERDPKVKRLAGKIDRVLVDAPCSGLARCAAIPTEVAPVRSGGGRACPEAGRDTARGGRPREGRRTPRLCNVQSAGRREPGVVEPFSPSIHNSSSFPAAAPFEEQRIALPMETYVQLWPHVHARTVFSLRCFHRIR